MYMYMPFSHLYLREGLFVSPKRDIEIPTVVFIPHEKEMVT